MISSEKNFKGYFFVVIGGALAVDTGEADVFNISSANIKQAIFEDIFLSATLVPFKVLDGF